MRGVTGGHSGITLERVDQLIEAAVRATVTEDLKGAESWLRRIDFDKLNAKGTRAMNAVWGTQARNQRPPLPVTKQPRTAFRAADVRRAFEQDHYTCRYAHCGKQTIAISVLRELSRLFPLIVPYHPNWKPVRDHILYWTWTTSREHGVAFPFGGTAAIDNLITTCYQCNDIKNYLPLDSLGWTIAPRADNQWDGLTGYLSKLRQIHRADKWMFRDNRAKSRSNMQTMMPA